MDPETTTVADGAQYTNELSRVAAAVRLTVPELVAGAAVPAPESEAVS